MVRFLRIVGAAAIMFPLASCMTTHHHEHAPHAAETHRLPPGSNEILRALVTESDGLEVIISDVVIPPNASVPRHYHPGEEFLYLIEGSAIHREEGQPDRLLQAGDGYVIPPRAVHSPVGGPDGARAIVFRVHVEGQPERILVED